MAVKAVLQEHQAKVIVVVLLRVMELWFPVAVAAALVHPVKHGHLARVIFLMVALDQHGLMEILMLVVGVQVQILAFL